MVRSFVLCAAVVAVAGPAAAQVAGRTVTNWAAAPTSADMAAAYPEKARAAGVSGGVELMCTTARNGAMSDCDVVGENPRGYGFGSAARKLAGQLKAADVPNGTEVRVPITFAASVKTPLWSALPSVDELQAAAPKTEGGPNDVRVTLVCDVQAGGSLSGCGVDREEPAGQGFGPAILSLAPKFKVGLMSAEGTPTVGSKVRVPVRFALKPVQQAAK